MLSLKKKDQSCLAFIYVEDGYLIFRIIDSQSNYVSFTNDPKYSPGLKMLNDIKEFVKNFPYIFGNSLKAVILQIFELKGIPGYKDNEELCTVLKIIMDVMKIPYCFVTREQERCSTLIAATKDLNIQEMDVILTVSINGNTITSTHSQFTKNGYIMCREGNVENKSKDLWDVWDTSMKKHKPQKIILCNENQENDIIFQAVKKFLTRYGSVILLEKTYSEYIKKFIVEMGKWIFDKTSCQYYVHPKSIAKYEVCDSWNNLVFYPMTHKLLSIDKDETLPQTKSCFISKWVSVVKEMKENASAKYHKVDQKFHRTKLTVSIDSNYFYNLKIQPLMLPQFDTMLSKLNKASKSNIPVIGFCDNFSVICIYNNEKNGYCFTDSWNGIYGTELVIDFSREKPVCCEKQTLNKINFAFQSKYIVYDLIKIISMSSNAIKTKEIWGFKVTKDEENPVVIEMATLQGNKFSTPAFLMALLIKEHRKIIKNEAGEKPEKFGFCILDENYGIEEKERIQKGLKESCELLKVGFEFVEI